jgi:hypothetical protein
VAAREDVGGFDWNREPVFVQAFLALSGAIALRPAPDSNVRPPR